jgi:predicted nucleic acid-binding Zn ribbon protein
MSPRYDYVCPAGHDTERFFRIVDRDVSVPCETCGAPTIRTISAPHVEPDGVYSYAPNLGSEASWERRRAAIKDGVKVYPKID